MMLKTSVSNSVAARSSRARSRVTSRSPSLVEVDLGPELVEHLHTGRETGFDRVFEQQALREGVQGADRGAVELVERPKPLLGGLILAGVGNEVLESLAHPLAQLGGGLLGEGDRRDALERGPGIDQGDHPGHEGSGLSRPCAGLDEQRVIEIVLDPVPFGLIRGQLGGGRCEVGEFQRQLAVGHGSAVSVATSWWFGSSFGAASARYGARFGSFAMPSKRRRASRTPSPSGSQYSQATHCRVDSSGCCGKCPAAISSTIVRTASTTLWRTAGVTA